MSTIKVFSLGGLDKKSNDLIRLPEKASDMLNMEYDSQSTLKKRNGFSEVLIDGSDIDSFAAGTIKDIIYYANKDELVLLVLSSGSIYVWACTRSGANWVSRLVSGAYLYSTDAMFPVSYCENQNNLYFSFQDLQTPVIKYDGGFTSISGLLVPFNTYIIGSRGPIVTDGATGVFNGTTSSSGYYLRTWLEYTDYNGNITNGPYIQSQSQYNLAALDVVARIVNPNNLGVQNKYIIMDNIAAYTLNSANRTIKTTAHNCVAGDHVLLVDDDNGDYIITSPANTKTLKLIVESVVANTSITFTAASIGTSSTSIDIFYTRQTFIKNCKIKVAASKTKDTGYEVLSVVYPYDNDYQGGYLDTSSDYNTGAKLIRIIDVGLGTRTLIPMEDVYDSTTLKTAPPICKYLESFGDQIVYGNIGSVIDLDNHWYKYNIADIVMYSDISTGDGPENVSEGNRQKIGDSRDGSITGLRRANDSMMVFKNHGVYSLDGVLIEGQYALRKINTNYVGCTSEKSILQSDEGVYFQGHNGIYFTNGVNVNKLTYEIDPLFLSGSYLYTKAARIKKKQKSIFYVPDIASGTANIVVIDYYYNQIYMWDFAYSPSLAMVEDINGNVYFSDGIKLYVFDDSYSDGDTAISSLYSTTWHHAGEPSLNKKWLSLRLFALTDAVYTTSVSTCGDWNSATTLTTNNISFASADQTKFVMLNMMTKKSLRVTFSNTSTDNMVLTGYELTYEMFNAVDKN